jgi:hypothetical protein
LFSLYCSLSNNVLKPSVKQYGIAGLMQPVMDYRKFLHIQLYCMPKYADKRTEASNAGGQKLTQIGVIFIKDNCIVKTERCLRSLL